MLRRPWWPGLLGKGPASFTEARGTNSRGLFGRRDGGSGGSPRRGSGNGDGGGGGVFLRTGELGLVPGNESEREGRESFLAKQMGAGSAREGRGAARQREGCSALLANRGRVWRAGASEHGGRVAAAMGQGRPGAAGRRPVGVLGLARSGAASFAGRVAVEPWRRSEQGRQSRGRREVKHV